jgi:hypothetical protein
MSWFKHRPEHSLAKRYGSAGYYKKRPSKPGFMQGKNVVRMWAQGSRVTDPTKTKSGVVTDVEHGNLKVKWDEERQPVAVGEEDVRKVSVGQLRTMYEHKDSVKGKRVVFKENPRQRGQYFIVGKESLGYNEPYSWARFFRGMGAKELVFKNV